MYNSTTNSLVKGSGWGRRTYVDKYWNTRSILTSFKLNVQLNYKQLG